MKLHRIKNIRGDRDEQVGWAEPLVQGVQVSQHLETKEATKKEQTAYKDGCIQRCRRRKEN